MSVIHLVNSKNPTVVAEADAETTIGTEQKLTALDAASETNRLLCLLNGRFEEAFDTGLTNEDLENGND